MYIEKLPTLREVVIVPAAIIVGVPNTISFHVKINNQRECYVDN